MARVKFDTFWTDQYPFKDIENRFTIAIETWVMIGW